jgi:hypothetical protein
MVVDRFNNQQQYGNRVKKRFVAWTSSQKSLSARVKNERTNANESYEKANDMYGDGGGSISDPFGGIRESNLERWI